MVGARVKRQEKVIGEMNVVTERYRTEAEQSQARKREMRREWEDDTAARKKGGRQKWPVWVVQLVCELLVNGTPPSAIPSNIRTIYATLFDEDVSPPSIKFCRDCRAIVQIVGETIAAIKLARAKKWGQLWTDATTRRQIPFSALVIGLLGDGPNDTIDPTVVSSCIFMEDESSETQAAGIISKVSSVLVCGFFLDNYFIAHTIDCQD